MKCFTIPLFISIFVLLTACENVDLSKVSREDVNKVIVCPDKYIRFGSSCCLDKNNNQICDTDEKEESSQESYQDECSTNTCSGLDYVGCLMQSDGYKDKVVKGKVIGNCGVECLEDNDCHSDENCEDYKCVKEEEGILYTKIFEISQDMYDKQIDSVQLKFIPLCNGEQGSEILDIEVNGLNIFSAKPICGDRYGQLIPIGYTKIGENKIEFISKEKYNIDSANIDIKTIKEEGHIVVIKDLKLDPQELTIRKGDTVTWKHQDKGDGDDTRHYLAAHSNEFRTPILYYGDTFSHTFNTVGTFTYVDIVYKEKDDLRGEIIVEVEYTVNSDCDSNEECNNYKCVKKEAECEDECVEGEVACENEVTRWYCYLQSNGCYDKIYEECREGDTCKDGRCCTKSIMECGLDNECLPESMRALWCVGDDVYGEDWHVSCINPNTAESYCERCVINKKVGHCEGCIDGVCPVLN